MAVAYRNRLHRQGAINITAGTVVEDDHGGGYAATAHLIEHGHRRIGFIGDSSSIATTAGGLTDIILRCRCWIDENQRFVSLGPCPAARRPT